MFISVVMMIIECMYSIFFVIATAAIIDACANNLVGCAWTCAELCCIAAGCSPWEETNENGKK